MDDAPPASQPRGVPRDIDTLTSDQLAKLTNAYLYRDDGQPGQHWWLWLLPRFGSENSGRLDIGERADEPSRDELIALLGARGLMPIPNGWGVWETYPSGGRRRVNIASIAAYTEQQAELARVEAHEKANGTTKTAVAWGLWLSGLAALLAFVSLGHFAYGFYVFLRVAIASAALVLAVLAVRRKHPLWLIGFAPAVVLWNPIIPIDMTRASWEPYDIVAAALFVWSWVSWLRVSAKSSTTGRS